MAIFLLNHDDFLKVKKRTNLTGHTWGFSEYSLDCGLFPVAMVWWVKYYIATIQRGISLSEYYKGNMALIKGNITLKKGNMALRHVRKS